jgi:predicted NACHT family NTPase
MNTRKENLVNISKKQGQKIEAAKKNFNKLQIEIAPFIKKRKFLEHSPSEQWVDTYSLDSTEQSVN